MKETYANKDGDMHLILEADHVDTSDETAEFIVLSKKQLGNDIQKRVYFFDLKLFTMVDGIVNRSQVVEPAFEVQLTIKLEKGTDSYEKIVGYDLIYRLARYRMIDDKLVIDKDIRVNPEVDTDGNYSFNFTSDKFSTYAIYSYPAPHNKVVPNTGVAD